MKAVVLDPTATSANVAGEPVEVGVHGPTGQRVATISERLAEYVAKHFPHLEIIEDEVEHFLHLDEHEAQLEEQQRSEDAAAAEAAVAAQKQAEADAAAAKKASDEAAAAEKAKAPKGDKPADEQKDGAKK